MKIDAEYHRKANMGFAKLSVKELNAKRNHIVGLMRDDRRTLQAVDAWLEVKDIEVQESKG
jgi:hypothetical protein